MYKGTTRTALAPEQHMTKTSPKSPRSPATPVRLVKAFKVAVFKLHNPSQRKRAVMRDAMKRAHLAYGKLLDAHLPDQDEIDRLAALPKRERPSTWIISHGFHSGHVWLVPAARTKTGAGRST